MSPMFWAQSPTQGQEWVIGAAIAARLLREGATCLDARDEHLRAGGILEGSVPVDWTEFSRPEAPNNGKLLEDDALLTEKLQAIGVFRERPVVVVADPLQGFGEDGRIVWMLRSLGHPQAVLVDGGYPALVSLGLPVAPPARIQPQRGDFRVERTDRWSIDRDTLRARLGSEKLAILDGRSLDEYRGATLYGEARGGHIPGAVHLHYRELLDADGSLLPAEAIAARLRQVQVPADAEIICYCTAGVRAAWLTAVLTHLGWRARNYPGSIYEWAAADPQQFPLEL